MKRKSEVQAVDQIEVVSESEAADRISERFTMAEEMIETVCNGGGRAIIISGPAGLGKTELLRKILHRNDPDLERHSLDTGYVRATGLYRRLYNFRFPGNVCVFDDADSVFASETSLNLMKAAMDTTERRILSWQTEYILSDDDGASIPKSFDYDGGCVITTNYDFERLISNRHKFTPHLEALMSRAMYIDLGMKTPLDFMVRVKMVCENEGMLRSRGLTASQERDVLEFMQENLSLLREVSLRMAVKISDQLRAYPKNWRRYAEITCLKKKMA